MVVVVVVVVVVVSLLPVDDLDQVVPVPPAMAADLHSLMVDVEQQLLLRQLL